MKSMIHERLITVAKENASHATPQILPGRPITDILYIESEQSYFCQKYNLQRALHDFSLQIDGAASGQAHKETTSCSALNLRH